MQTQNKNTSTIRADFYKVNQFSCYFPKEDKNEFNALKEFYTQLIKAIPSEIELKLLTNLKEEGKLPIRRRNVEEVKCSLEDIWLKDYMGFIAKNGVIKPTYSYSGCSCKLNVEENKKFNATIVEVLTNDLKKTVNGMPLIWDCSNLVTNGKIGFISTKIIKDNPSKTEEEILNIISTELGINPIIVENNKYDSLGQISGYMQFINKSTVAISEYPSIKGLEYDNGYLEQLVVKVKEQGFEVIRLREIPSSEYTKCLFSETQKNCSLKTNGTYINFLIINKIAIIPTYTNLEDVWECNEYNKDVLSAYFEEVVQINCDELANFGGLLNSICITE